jgi:hypothetical protein
MIPLRKLNYALIRIALFMSTDLVREYVILPLVINLKGQYHQNTLKNCKKDDLKTRSD